MFSAGEPEPEGNTPLDDPAALSPKVRSLLGALGTASVDEADYQPYLERKHQ